MSLFSRKALEKQHRDANEDVQITKVLYAKPLLPAPKPLKRGKQLKLYEKAGELSYQGTKVKFPEMKKGKQPKITGFLKKGGRRLRFRRGRGFWDDAATRGKQAWHHVAKGTRAVIRHTHEPLSGLINLATIPSFFVPQLQMPLLYARMGLSTLGAMYGSDEGMAATAAAAALAYYGHRKGYFAALGPVNPEPIRGALQPLGATVYYPGGITQTSL